MDIKELKSSIENKSIVNSIIVFKYSDTDFVAFQYINEIKKIKEYEINIVEDINTVINNSNDIFGINDYNNTLNLYVCDTFECNNKSLINQKDLIIICKKIEKETEDLIKDFIVEIPKLEKWQIKDYAYSVCEGLNEEYIDNILDICQYDINRISNELDKLENSYCKAIMNDLI